MNYASITFTFDWEGKLKDVQTYDMERFKNVSIEDNIIKDSYIITSGREILNLYEEDYTSFRIDEFFPEWLLIDVNVDESSREQRSYEMIYGRVTSVKYDKTTTIGVERQLQTGRFRTCTFYAERGFYRGDEFTISWQGWLSHSKPEDFVKITINQEGYSAEGPIYSNPYYKTMQDSIIVTPPTEVNGEANINIDVSANGKEYNCNKLFLSLRQYNYNFPEHPFNGECSIFEGYTERGELVIENAPDWVTYKIDTIPFTDTDYIDYVENIPFTGWMTLTFDNNNGEYRNATIIVYTTSKYFEVKYKINIKQLGVEDKPDTPIEPTKTDAVFAIDTNSGEDYDSTSLLFKDNSANIYNTLEAKDNTLFLGNYQNSNFSLQINQNSSVFENLSIEEITKEVPFANLSLSTYDYVPDLTISSQDKKLFKKGEKYSLGLVFIKNNGVKSSVFYIGDYEPSSEPTTGIRNNAYYLSKPIAYTVFNTTIVNKLKSLGVIGVIPVYAKRPLHKIIGQGFLNPTISSRDRKNAENLDTQYNWFQRLDINNTSVAQGEGESLSTLDNIEFQSRGDDDVWTFSNKILTFNTPEVEAVNILTDALLEGCTLNLKYTSGNLIRYNNSVTVNTNSSYLHSKFLIPDGGYRTDMMQMRLALWKGYIDKGTKNESKPEFIADTKTDDSDHYKRFFVYPWQRNKIGGEGPESKIISKKYFTLSYIQTRAFTSLDTTYNIKKASIYNDEHPSLIKFDTQLYQGNVDYIINPRKSYRAFITDYYTVGGNTFNYPRAYSDIGVYAGYGTDGEITDPIYMRYKVAPHIVLDMGNIDITHTGGIICAELKHSDSSFVFDTSPSVLSSLPWLKCGNIVSLMGTGNPVIEFVEGDNFYGRFDSLRTYPYSNDDVNSITDIVSGMVCSRINLDARCDRNRGIGMAVVSNENFNIFNEVYNQDNNYFTFQYINLNDSIYNRTYSNSIQWSMTKNYGNEVDDWCNIQEINTLDLDGDKGPVRSLQRLNNDIISFQDSGIAQILYNESMQITSTSGVPIEIANSGKVNGKRYINDNCGCQNEKSITVTPSGLYFVDSINKSFFKLGVEGAISDICLLGGMKSWILNNNELWKCWYDPYTQEVVFTSPTSSIIYSDLFKRFQCFSSYEGIEYAFCFNGRVYMFKPTGTEYSTLWKRNAIDSSTFFSVKKPLEIEIIANPEPTMDKTFTNIEFRADGFLEGVYDPEASFTALRVTNEYQDTGTVLLTKENLKKKFRMWHMLMPRALKDSNQTTTLSEALLAKKFTPLNISNLSKGTSVVTNNTTNKVFSNDRIRNPWCKIHFDITMNNIDKFVVHDLLIQYI